MSKKKLVSQQTSSSLMKQQHGQTQQTLKPVDEALLQAVEQSDIKMIKKCIAHGANVNVSKDDKVTSLHIAAERGDVDVIKELLLAKDLDIDSRTAYGFTALYLAAQIGHEAVLLLLLRHGVKIDKGDQMGRTPLHIAVFRGHENIVLALIRNGADINARDAFGDVPLYYAIVARPNPKIARLLLKNGADPNARGTDSMGVLLEAVLNSNQPNQIKVVEMLIEGGADIKARDPIGQRSVLHITAMTGDVKMAERLLELGADINALNSAGKTAQEVARTHENYAVFSLLNTLSS